MSDKQFMSLAGFFILSALLYLGIKFWSKNELCKIYYPDLNRFACYISDTVLPQRTNR